MNITAAMRAETGARWAARDRAVPSWWLPPSVGRHPMSVRLHRLRENTTTLYNNGGLAWARILSAHNDLYLSGLLPAPAELIWSDDPYILANPQELDLPFQRFWALRKRERVHGPMGVIKAFVDDDGREPGIARLPAPLCGGRVIWRAVVVVYPSELPRTEPHCPYLPIVRDPGHAHDTVMVLPAEFWSPTFRAAWEAWKD